MASITLVRLEARRRALASACADIRQRGDASDKWEVIERGLDACADAGEVPELPRGLTEAVLRAARRLVFEGPCDPTPARVFSKLCERSVWRPTYDALTVFLVETLRLHTDWTAGTAADKVAQASDPRRAFVLAALRALAVTQKQQPNRRAVFTGCVAKLLEPLLHVCGSRDALCETRAIARRALAEAVFDREHLAGVHSLIADRASRGGSSLASSEPHPAASYQRALMEKIDAITRAAFGDPPDNGADCASFEGALEGLPCLLSALVSATLADEADRIESAEPQAKRARTTSKPRRAGALPMDALPFAFWAAVASSMTSCVSRRGRGSKALLCSDQLRCLRVCDQMLATLRESDRYSNRSTHDEYRVALVTEFAGTVLGFARQRARAAHQPSSEASSSPATDVETSVMECELLVLERLLVLEQQGLHPHLADVIARCLGVHGCASRAHPIASHVQRAGTQLAALLVSTYAALRQTDVFLEGLLTAAATRRGPVAALSLLKTPEFSSAFSQAVHSSPPGQTSALWHVFDAAFAHPPSQSDFVVEFFGAFLRGLLISPHSATALRQLCTETAQRFVRPTLELIAKRDGSDSGSWPDDSDSASQRLLALRLLGALLDMHTRCGVWCPSDDERFAPLLPVDVGGGISHAQLVAFSRAQPASPAAVHVRRAVAVVAMHRLMELHTAAAHASVPAVGVPADGVFEEARDLAAFLAPDTNAVPEEHELGWSLISCYALVWANYADETNVDAFLAWLFRADCSYGSPARVARTDAALFDIPTVAARVMPVMLESLTKLVAVPRSVEPGLVLAAAEHDVRAVLEHACSVGYRSEDGAERVVSEICQSARTSTRPRIADWGAQHQILRLMKLILSMPTQLFDSKDFVACFVTALALESLLAADDAFACEPVASMCRKLSAHCLRQACRDVRAHDGACWRGVVHIPASVLYDWAAATRAGEDCDCLIHLARVHLLLLRKPCAVPVGTNALDGLLSMVRLDVARVLAQNDPHPQLLRVPGAVLRVVAREYRRGRVPPSVAQLMESVSQQLLCAAPRLIASQAGIGVLADALVPSCQPGGATVPPSTFETLIARTASGFAELSTAQHAQPEEMEASQVKHEALVNLLTALCEALPHVAAGDALKGMFARLAALVLFELGRVAEVHEKNASALGCATTGATALRVLVEMSSDEQLDQLLTTVETTPTLGLARALSATYVVVSTVASNPRSDLLAALNVHARALLALLCRTLSTSTAPPWMHALALEALWALVNGSDQKLRSCDVAMLLSSVGALLGHFQDPSFTLSDADAHNGGAVVRSCMLLSLLLKKQSHFVCEQAPMLIRCARCVLCLVLASDNDAGRCGCARSTARLFEQFATHKAKLKKHLFALLLDYIRGVADFALPQQVTRALRPGVFALLDACGASQSPSFEMVHVHSLLDSRCQAHLKAVLDQFQSEHKWTGGAEAP